MASVDNYDVSEGTHNYVIDTHMDAAGITSEKLYQVTYGAVTQDVTKRLQRRRRLRYLLRPRRRSQLGRRPAVLSLAADVRDLTNLQMYPLVLSFACVTGSFENNVECFTETWLREADKAAAVIYGSSVNSYWDEDDILERRFFDARL